MSMARDHQRVKSGWPCKVRRRGPGGQGFIWVDGHFKDIHGRGAFVITVADGNSNFYHWNEIQYEEPTRPPPRPEPPPPARPPAVPRALATLGDALLARSNGKVELTSRPPPPPPTPDRSQIVAAPEPRPSATYQRSAPRKGRSRTPHTPTAIGNWLRTARMSRSVQQGEVAVAIGIPRTRMCNLELGDKEPSSDELVLFSAYFNEPLEKLEALAKTLAPPRPELPRPAPPVLRAPESEARALGLPSPTVELSGDYVQAIAAVIEALAPLSVSERRGVLEPLMKVL